MRKYLIPAVSLAALTLGSVAFAQTTTEQSTQATPSVDCAANPADPSCASAGAQKADSTTTQPSDTTAQQSTGTATDTGTAASGTTASDTGTATTTTDPATSGDSGTAASGTTTDPATTATTTPTDSGTATTAPSVDTGTAASGMTITGNEFLASNFIGKTVYTSAKENIGDINDLVVSKDGTVKAAVIGVGGFLGIGEKDVMMPLDKLTMTKDENGSDMLTIAATRQELESAPTFNRTAMVTGTGTAQ